MNSEKQVFYDRIGKVHYRKNRRARNISIRISNNGEVKVTVPGWCTFMKAEGFVHKKSDWIEQKLHTIKRKREENLVWERGDSIKLIHGSIKIVNGAGEAWGITSKEQDFMIKVPDYYNPASEKDREAMIDRLGKIGFKVSRDVLPSILAELASKHGFSYERINIRRMRTRWGSCSAKNNISLSSALAFVSYDLVEYVCLHELVHTVHKNHSKAFWNALEDVLPDATERRKMLRQQPLIV
jgi:predicted metal-dependent hydrolase